MAQLTDVNTTDIAGAIRLGCETMQRIFNEDDGGIPHFEARAWPPEQVGFGFQTPYTEAHVPGRHLSALLEAEDCLGVEVAASAIENHRRALFYTLSGPVALPLNRDKLGGQLIDFADHNIREAMHGLWALVKYRQDGQADALARNFIKAVFEYWNPKTGWDRDRLDRLGLHSVGRNRSFVWGPARAIGPLVKHYRATGYGPALELALTLASKVTGEYFLDDGAFDRTRFGAHTHSTTCTLSSLAQLADLLQDAPLMERVRTFYENGIRHIRDEIGWVIELADLDEVNPDRGEINNTGDIMETALILGKWGWTQHYADAERMLRCHMLPAQLRDVSFIKQPANPTGEDRKRDVAARMRGAWGFPAPYGHHPLGLDVVDFCLDIVGGGVLSLCAAWREAVRTDAAGHRVNLLFDRETPDLSVASPYTYEGLSVTVHRPAPLWVRIPEWVDRKALVIEGSQKPALFRGDYAFFADPPVSQPLIFRFELPTSDIVLHHKTNDIRVRLRGDEVQAMDNFGADLTFFPET